MTSQLSVEAVLREFVETEVLPGLPVTPAAFWSALEEIVAEFGPKNAALLAKRDTLQSRIDAYWTARRGKPVDVAEQERFLREIGYLVDEAPDFEITTAEVDPEIASMAGPQLVVPLSNARYALNAANARWGSLYDALYGTDALEPPLPAGPYNAERGNKVIARARAFLDDIAPLTTGSHADAAGYAVEAGRLVVRLAGPGRRARRRPDPSQWSPCRDHH